MNVSGISRKTLFGRILRFPLRLVPPGMIVPILQGELRGHKWITGTSTHGCWLGSYEFSKQRLISDMVEVGSVAFDIGAHVGFYTLLFSRLVGSSGKVFAFEPVPGNIQYLRKHIAINRLSNIEVVEAAVGDIDVQANFEVDSDSNYMGHLADTDGPNTMPVTQITIDALVSSGQAPVPDYLKIDIEGAELRALKGARKTLEQHHPVVFLATHGDEIHQACCNFLESLGYTLAPVVGEDIMRTDEIVGTFTL